MKIGNQGDGGGRPLAVLTPKQVKKLQSLASTLTKGQLADYFSMSETTFRAIEARQPEVSDAYKKGRATQQAKMGKNLLKLAMDGNVAANIFWLKCQAGWKETTAEAPPAHNITSFEVVEDEDNS